MSVDFNFGLATISKLGVYFYHVARQATLSPVATRHQVFPKGGCWQYVHHMPTGSERLVPLGKEVIQKIHSHM